MRVTSEIFALIAVAIIALFVLIVSVGGGSEDKQRKIMDDDE